MEEIVAEAAQISQNTADSRTGTYAQQLNNRFTNLATSVKVSNKSLGHLEPITLSPVMNLLVTCNQSPGHL